MELLNALGRFGDASPQGRAVRQEALEIATVCLSPDRAACLSRAVAGARDMPAR